LAALDATAMFVQKYEAAWAKDHEKYMAVLKEYCDSKHIPSAQLQDNRMRA
jgi:hypothetical protein